MVHVYNVHWREITRAIARKWKMCVKHNKGVFNLNYSNWSCRERERQCAHLQLCVHTKWKHRRINKCIGSWKMMSSVSSSHCCCFHAHSFTRAVAVFLLKHFKELVWKLPKSTAKHSKRVDFDCLFKKKLNEKKNPTTHTYWIFVRLDPLLIRSRIFFCSLTILQFFRLFIFSFVMSVCCNCAALRIRRSSGSKWYCLFLYFRCCRFFSRFVFSVAGDDQPCTFFVYVCRPNECNLHSDGDKCAHNLYT